MLPGLTFEYAVNGKLQLLDLERRLGMITHMELKQGVSQFCLRKAILGRWQMFYTRKASY